MSGVLIVLLALAPVPPAPLPPESSPAGVARSFDVATPSLAEVQRAAVFRARLDPRAARRWLRRARVAAVLPELSTGLDHRTDTGYVLDQAADAPNELSSDEGRSRVLRVKLSWSLDRLIFNPDELRAVRATIDLGEARERLLIDITQLYFQRLRLLIEQRTIPPADLRETIEREAHIREIEGIMSGLTGLRFRR